MNYKIYLRRSTDETSKVHTVETKEELKGFFGNIDTPAEVKVQLFLNGKRDVSRYKKEFVDYKAWFCDEATFPNAKCTYVVTSYGRIEEKQGK